MSARSFGHLECIETRVGKFIENHHPELVSRLVGHEPADGGGFARAETARDDVRPCGCADVGCSRQFAILLALVSCGHVRATLANMAVKRLIQAQTV